MPKPLHCCECGIRLSVADADMAVQTDAGLCHRECFAGPLPPGQESAAITPISELYPERGWELASEEDFKRMTADDMPADGEG